MKCRVSVFATLVVQDMINQPARDSPRQMQGECVGYHRSLGYDISARQGLPETSTQYLYLFNEASQKPQIMRLHHRLW